MSDHTPGPWVVEVFASCDTEPGEGAMTLICAYADEDGKEGFALAWVNRWSYGDDPPTGESAANARLIAAAPELLAACRIARQYPAAITTELALDAAIAKATESERE